MKKTEETYFIYEKENEGRVECYMLAPGIFLMFDQIYTNSWMKGDSSIFSDEMLILNFCRNGRCDVSLTGSRYAIVKEAESMILSDLSKRITAKEMADYFGISESSFKLYVKGILGESYLAYFRRKRMEKAAELLEATTLKVIEITNAVGYENQGKFAKVFSEVYRMTPLEYRRWTR